MSCRKWPQKVANCSRQRPRHALPNVVEGGIRFWSWRLRVCCKRLGDRSALRWGSGDETQSRLHLMRLAACTVERKIVTELTRFTSSMIPDQDVALVQNVLAFHSCVESNVERRIPAW